MTFNQVYQYNFPTTIRFGAGASKELGDYLLKNNSIKAFDRYRSYGIQLDFFKVIINDLKRKKFP
jgi:hypothetical protein